MIAAHSIRPDQIAAVSFSGQMMGVRRWTKRSPAALVHYLGRPAGGGSG
ncbi:MAG: hypothetical protein R2911_10915 [Caldilineaceae bacterium]